MVLARCRGPAFFRSARRSVECAIAQEDFDNLKIIGLMRHALWIAFGPSGFPFWPEL